MPFVTILTRVHPARPRCLARNVASVQAQTDQDLQHLLLRPEIEPHDVIKVGPLIHLAAPRVEGRYVMQLPDDDRFCSPGFVRDLKAAVGPGEDADMVIFRMEHGAGPLPPDDKWRIRAVEPGCIAGQNVIVKRAIYAEASREWLRPIYEADFYYIKAALALSRKVVWWDYVGIASQGMDGCSAGRPESLIELKPEVER